MAVVVKALAAFERTLIAMIEPSLRESAGLRGVQSECP